jgi:hypothetical protein
MTNKRPSIPPKTLDKILSWSNRHCCMCEKQCTVNIEIHHLDKNPQNNELDNLIPLCFDCHGNLEHYNNKHPKGLKYRINEIKKRREQIYEKYTIPYLRSALIKISNLIDDKTRREWGNFTFRVEPLSIDLPSKLRIKLVSFIDNKKISVDLDDLYEGRKLWNINPFFIINGNFNLPIKKKEFNELRIQIFWSVIDIYEREHEMLPFSYVLRDKEGDFYYNKLQTA